MQLPDGDVTKLLRGDYALLPLAQFVRAKLLRHAGDQGLTSVQQAQREPLCSELRAGVKLMMNEVPKLKDKQDRHLIEQRLTSLLDTLDMMHMMHMRDDGNTVTVAPPDCRTFHRSQSEVEAAEALAAMRAAL